MEGRNRPGDDASDGQIAVVALASGYRLTSLASGPRELVLQADVVHDLQIDHAAEIMRRAPDEIGTATVDGPVRTSAGCRTVEWRRSDSLLTAFERSADRETWLPGLSATASALGAQRWVVATYGAEFDPIKDEALVAVAASVMSPGTAVDGVRYPPDGANSGWILVNEGFSGTVGDLEHHHAYHVTGRRPDLERYFGLPTGWRFEWSSHGEAVFMDTRSDEH